MRQITDYFVWTQAQTQVLHNRSTDGLDWEGLAEEIEDMGKSQKNAIRNHMRIRILHLLKWQYQPERRSQSWKRSAINALIAIEDEISDSPSLSSFLDGVLDETYQKAARQFRAETGLTGVLPETCPFAAADIRQISFFPS